MMRVAPPGRHWLLFKVATQKTMMTENMHFSTTPIHYPDSQWTPMYQNNRKLTTADDRRETWMSLSSYFCAYVLHHCV